MAGRDVLFFDGGCGLCLRSARWLKRLDWLGRLEATDMHGRDDVPVDLEIAMAGIPMRTRGGRVLLGMAAVRRALAQTPLGCVPGALMYLPGISHIADAAYRAIARHRRRECSVDLAAGRGG